MNYLLERKVTCCPFVHSPVFFTELWTSCMSVDLDESWWLEVQPRGLEVQPWWLEVQRAPAPLLTHQSSRDHLVLTDTHRQPL